MMLLSPQARSFRRNLVSRLCLGTPSLMGLWADGFSCKADLEPQSNVTIQGENQTDLYGEQEEVSSRSSWGPGALGNTINREETQEIPWQSLAESLTG